jgi:glycosyltransferase involved in cell wall biosynthesis
MSSPTVSVVVPNYNHAHFLPRCLESLLNQTLPPPEIIVIDDCSTDNSLEVLRAYAGKHPTIKVHVNERNLGVCPNLNRANELARGDYVYSLAADDEAMPTLLERSMELLHAHPEAGLCSGLCEWRDGATGLRWHMGAGMPRKPCYLSPTEMVALGRQGRLTISNPSGVYKKSTLLEAGGWLPELRWYTDWFGAFVVGFRHGICHVPEVLSVFNLSPNSYYHSAQSGNERADVMELVLQLLESDRYKDVAPMIAQSGVMGTFDWPMPKVIARDRSHRQFLTSAYLRRFSRRYAEVVGRRFFPDWLARMCLKAFYHGR